MSQEVRADAADKIAAILFAAETAVETAIAKNAEAVSRILAAREAGGLTIYHGQEALEEAHILSDLLIRGRRQIGQVHRKLEATHRQVGLGAAAYGPGGKPPEGAAPVREVA
jgi:hypothetical protein